MPALLKKLEPLRPLYNLMYRFVLLVCKLLLVLDIAITSFAVVGRFVPFIPDPAWSEEVVLTLMSYMAVLSAALAIRRNAHIRMTTFDRYLPSVLVKILDLLSDFAVLALALVMLLVGWRYSTGLGALGSYVSMPWLSKFWQYFPIPVAGIAMLVFELERIFMDLEAFYGKEEK
ncbi:TRAP transporter small permease subunit [Oribacterium sp. oral taxon 102]|uniref:TRAP transporter small permease n=1 Tax=Oribacterium sp. oral taxon 102 TaxID=671214 RepID=UPI0015C177AA|nr:TRAP transporter small permease subunit [Oribacterium sp. oral taxon 102]NWO22082.1 TRAP transporter small permease subunit [Oribacterium sp. oral taxon 102]